MKAKLGYGIVLPLMFMLITQTGIAFDTKEPAATDPQQLGAAAQKGDAKAMYELGKMYENGVGVIQNYVQAHAWYNISASRGYTEAAKARDAIAKKMNVDQLAEAQKLAINWKPSTGSDSLAKAGVKEGEAKKGGEKEAAKSIWDAAKNGDTARVKELIKQGTSPNVKDAKGWFPLMYAAFGGHKDTVATLLEAGADVNMKKPDGSTALMAAEQKGYTEIIALLKGKSQQSERILRYTPEPDISFGSMTAICRNKRLYDAEKAVIVGTGLFDAKTAFDFPNEYELQNNGKVVHDRASGLTWQQSGSDKPMSFCEVKKYVAQLNREGFAGYHDWRLPTIEEAMSLMEPTEMNGDLYIDPVFNKIQVSIYTSDYSYEGIEPNCDRAIWFATFKIPFFTYYLDVVYVRAVRSDNKLTVVPKEISAGILDAVKNGDTATVIKLLKQGTDPNMKNKEGWTPLMYAAFGGHTKIVGALLTFGADVNMKKPDGSTALMAAALGGHKSVVEILLDEGADRFAKFTTNKKDLTALIIAEQKGYHEIAAFLNHIEIRSRDQYEVWKQRITERAERANGFLNGYHGIYGFWCEGRFIQEKYDPPYITICWSEGDEVCYADPRYKQNLVPKRGKLVKKLNELSYKNNMGQIFIGPGWKVRNQEAEEFSTSLDLKGGLQIIGFNDKYWMIMNADMKGFQCHNKCEGF